MIGEIGPNTTDVNTYVPGTYTSALAVYRGDVQHVGDWLRENSGGEMVTFVWKVGDFPGENRYTGGSSLPEITEANDEEFALKKGEQIASFQEKLRIATRGADVDYNGIGRSWGLAAIASSEVAGARYRDIASLAGAGMPDAWTPREGTRYHHFSYTDALSMAQATGQVWDGRNPGTDPAFTSHIYRHANDFPLVIRPPIEQLGLPLIWMPANSDPLGTHDLIASVHPTNQPPLLQLMAGLR